MAKGRNVPHLPKGRLCILGYVWAYPLGPRRRLTEMLEEIIEMTVTRDDGEMTVTDGKFTIDM